MFVRRILTATLGMAAIGWNVNVLAQHEHHGDAIKDSGGSHGDHGHASSEHHAHDTISTRRWEAYGNVYLSLEQHDPGKAGATNLFLDTDGTIFGFRGSYAIEGDSRFFWQLESTVNYDEINGHGTEIAGHDSYAGLTGKWGTVFGGKKNTAYTAATHHFDNFHHLAGDYRMVLGQVGNLASGTGGHHGGAFHVRAPDIVSYKTPSWSGLSAEASIFALNETSAVVADEPSAYSGAVSFQKAGFLGIAAYEVHNNYDTYAGTSTVTVDKTEATMVGGMYHWNQSMIGVIYETIDVQDANSTVVPNKSRDAAYVGFQHKFGKHSLRLAYGMADDFAGSDGAEMLAAGLVRSIGKKTEAYLIYVGVDNESQGLYGTFKTSPFQAGSDPSTIAVGFVHSY